MARSGRPLKDRTQIMDKGTLPHRLVHTNVCKHSKVHQDLHAQIGAIEASSSKTGSLWMAMPPSASLVTYWDQRTAGAPGAEQGAVLIIHLAVESPVNCRADL